MGALEVRLTAEVRFGHCCGGSRRGDVRRKVRRITWSAEESSLSHVIFPAAICVLSPFTAGLVAAVLHGKILFSRQAEFSHAGAADGVFPGK